STIAARAAATASVLPPASFIPISAIQALPLTNRQGRRSWQSTPVGTLRILLKGSRRGERGGATPATVTWGRDVSLSANPTDSGTGSGAPSGVAQVVFRLDQTKTLATVITAPYQFTWNTRKIPFGQHTLTAVATDKAGNSATSPPVTV